MESARASISYTAGSEVEAVHPDAPVLGHQVFLHSAAPRAPSPSRSNFTWGRLPRRLCPIAGRCGNMRAHSTGQCVGDRRSQMTMPPEWMPRCRGRQGSVVDHPLGDAVNVVGPPGPVADLLAHASCWPGEKPGDAGHVTHRAAPRYR